MADESMEEQAKQSAIQTLKSLGGISSISAIYQDLAKIAHRKPSSCNNPRHAHHRPIFPALQTPSHDFPSYPPLQ